MGSYYPVDNGAKDLVSRTGIVTVDRGKRLSVGTDGPSVGRLAASGMAAEEDHTESEQDALRSSAAPVGRTFFPLGFRFGDVS